MAWTFPHWTESNDDMPAALGADLSVETMTVAYQNGYYPAPPTNEYWREWNEREYGAALDAGDIPVLGDRYPGFTLPWWSRGQRAVLKPQAARLGSSTRRKLRDTGWSTTMDTATRTVIENCGPARGRETWLSRDIADAYLRLSETGVVHSVEVWDRDGELIGGMFGVLTGTVLTGETGFRTRDNVVRVALLDAVLRLADAGGELLDVQIRSSYLASIGVADIPKKEFYATLEAGRGRRLVLPAERRGLDRLLQLGRGTQ